MSDGKVTQDMNEKFELEMRKVPERWKSLKPSDNYITAAALLAFASQLELFSAFNTAPGRLVARSVLLRSMLEVLADLAHIMRDPAKQSSRAKSYVDSANKLRPELLKTVMAMSATSPSTRMKKLTDWTTSSIEDRMQKITPSMLHLYDVLSYCSHSHPGKVWLFGNNTDEGPITESYLRRLALTQMVSVATRSGDLGVLNDSEKVVAEDMRMWIDQNSDH
jgi:hypothetical protein